MSLLMTEICFSYNALSLLIEGLDDCSTLEIKSVLATLPLLLAAELGHQMEDPAAMQNF
jgi:hypothetical protein